jgi:hypothetical protein
MRVPSLGWRTLAAVLLLAGLGCGGSKKLVPVNGVLTLDGRPVENANVTFLPEGEGQSAFGTTGKDGSFQLTTQKPNDGAMPGSYKVIVVYGEAYEGGESSGGMQAAFAGQDKARKAAAKIPPKYVIPAKYAQPGQTDLKFTIPAPGKIEINLKSR